MTNAEIAKQKLEKVLSQYRNGLVTEIEKNDSIIEILYWVLYPEQFPQA